MASESPLVAASKAHNNALLNKFAEKIILEDPHVIMGSILYPWVSAGHLFVEALPSNVDPLVCWRFAARRFVSFPFLSYID